MRRLVFIVSIDDARYNTVADHVIDMGMEPVRVEGVDPDVIPDPVVEALNTRRPRVRSAIRLAMRKAATVAAGRGIIIQDDVRFTIRPRWHPDLFVSYAPRLPGNHLCPRAFAVPATAVEPLVAAWSDETQNACSGWHTLTLNIAMFPSTVEMD